MAIYHVSQLKPNEISANLRSGTFALKWPEEASKPVVINYSDKSISYSLTQTYMIHLDSNSC